MNRRPNAPKCILGVVMVVLLVIGGWATTTARLSTSSKGSIATAIKPTAGTSSAAQIVNCSTCGINIPQSVCNTFEIEGNAADDSGFPGLPEDWNDIISSADANAVSAQGGFSGVPGGGSAALIRTYVDDTSTAAVPDQIYTGGSTKDFLDIGVPGGWRHANRSGQPDKDDIGHAGAAKYHDAATGHDVLTFFADRFDNSGDANIGFWFFQNPITPLSDGTFSGVHAIGDILVLSSFTKGGGTSTIRVLKWVGNGTDCTDANAFIDVKSDSSSFPNGSLCDITNTALCPGTGIVNGDPALSPVTVNWRYTQKGGTACPSGPCPIPEKGLFFEGAIDLSALNLGGECFATFLAETRSSAEVSAVLKDFALGNFQQCKLTCKKEASPTTVCAGQSTTYTYTVTNPGSVALTVNVRDDNGTAATGDDFSPFDASGGCADSPATTTFNLAAFATATCTRTVTLTGTGDHTNNIHVTGTAGTTTLTCDSSATVTVNPNPTCSISGPTPVCAGSTGNTYTSSATAGSTHSWSISGNGTITSGTTGSSVTVTAGAAGGFTLTDNISLNGCLGVCTLDVTVASNPTVAITATACGTSITLTATVTGGTAPFSYAWTVPAGVTDPGNVDHFDTTVPGSYSVVVTDANSCTGSRAATVGVCLFSTQAASATASPQPARRRRR